MKPPSAILVGSFCITLILGGFTASHWRNETRDADSKLRLALSNAADNTQALLSQRLQRFDLILRSVKGFYEGSDFVTRKEFKHYVQTLQLDSTKSGLQGVAIALRVGHADKERHLAEIRRRGASDYQIRPDGLRPEYTPIVLIEPANEANALALGFDIGTNPVARAALDKSLVTGEGVVTGLLGLAQDAGQKRPAIVMYMPLMKDGGPTVLGWVSGPFRIADVMQAIRPQLDPDIDIFIHDGPTATIDNQLYGTERKGSVLSEVRQLDVGGRQWTILIDAGTRFKAQHVDPDHWFMPLIGGVASVLLGYIFWLIGTGRARAIRLAQKMTHETHELHAAREAVLNAIPDLLFEVDGQGVVLDYRAGRNDFLAAPPETFLGKNFTDFLPVPAADTCLAALRQAGAAGYATGAIYSLPLAQGETWFELSVSAVPKTHDSVQRFIFLIRDITVRKESEAALLASNAKLQLLETCVARLNDIVLITEAEPFGAPGPRIVFVNDAFERRTGFKREEVIGKTPRILQGPKTDKMELGRIRKAMERWEPVRAELVNYTKSGAEYWIELDIVPISDPTGWFTHWVAVERDVTERKQTQLELQASLKDKTALLMEVHHRVKNNLQVITSLLRLESRRSKAAEVVDTLQNMQGRIQAMAQLYESIYRSGTFASIDLGTYLARIASQAFRSQAINPESISLELQMGSVLVGMDQATSAGLLLNELISNCLKHGFPNGRSGQILVALEAVRGNDQDSGDRWQLRVCDNGVGLPGDFEHRRTNSLGLQLAGDLSRQLGGRMDITSSPSEGTQFSVEFTAMVPAALVMPL